MTKDYSQQLDRLAQVFNDDTTPSKILPTKPDDPQSVLSLPPKALKNFTTQGTPEETVEARKLTLEHLPTNTKESDLTPDSPTNQRLLTKENTQKIIIDELLQHHALLQEEQGQEQTISESEKLSQEQQAPKRRGRPKGSKNKQKEKLSPIGAGAQAEKVSHNETKKLSHTTPDYLPVNLSFPSSTSVKGKTSLCYALLYARELTPVQVETLLQNQLELNLTSAEVIALSLIDRTTKGDPKAEKIYWDLLKNQAKNDKITPEKSQNTLLDEALAKSENAIFGEIVVDTPENP